MKKIIAITPIYHGENPVYFPLENYINLVMSFDCIPLVIPISEDKKFLSELVEMVDGIIFSGGHDIDPSLYNEEPIKELGMVVKIRDKMESILFEEAKKKNIPLFGVCRGFQMINVLMGGTLYQDLNKQYRGIKHKQDPPYDTPFHPVYKKTEKFSLVEERIFVNSLHHQGIKKLAEGLNVLVESEDGLVEGFYSDDLRIIAVQWHPEYFGKGDTNSRRIFGEFIKKL